MPKRQQQRQVDLPPRKRSRPKFDTSLIPMEDLYNSPSMTGLISFLERPPTSGEDITDLPAFRHLKKDQFPAPDVNGDHESNTLAYLSTVLIEDTVPLNAPIKEYPPISPKSTVANIGTVLTEGLVETQQQQKPSLGPAPTMSTVANMDTVPIQSTVLNENLPTPSTVPIESTVPAEGPGKPVRSTGMHFALNTEPVSSRSTVLAKSTLVDRSVIGRQVGGRPVTNIHPLRTAQDGHSMAEDGLFRKLWETATAEQGNDRYRIIEIGYERAGALIHINKTGAKRLIQALTEKLSIQVVANQNSDERIGKRYRIYSFAEIIRRRRAQGFTHFQKNRGGVTLVRGEGRPTTSTVPIESTGLKEARATRSTVVTVTPDRVPTESTATVPTVSTSSYNHSVLTTKEEPPPPDAVLEALKAVAGEATDASARAITDACRKRCPDAKASEIAHFIHYRGQRANGIANMTAFLIVKVPEHFEGRAFYLYRDQEARRIKANFETQRQNLEETRKMCQDILSGSSSEEAELAWAKERLSEIDQDLTRINQPEE